MTRPLRIAIPNKGRLCDDTIQLMRRAGIHLRGSSDRKLFATALDGRLHVMYLRAKDIPEFVADGTVDAGITGLDVVRESGAELTLRSDLGFGSCRLIAAVPNEHAAKSTKDLPQGCRVATSFPNLTREFFAAQGQTVQVVEVTGACEVTPTLGVAEAITDLTSSGSTLAMNHLREIGLILASTCHLVAPAKSDPVVADELDRLQFALDSVVAARSKRYLLADIPRSQLDSIRSFLPGLAGPTVVDIAGDPDTVAIQVVIDENAVFDAVHELKERGGRGILIVPIDRLVN